MCWGLFGDQIFFVKLTNEVYDRCHQRHLSSGEGRQEVACRENQRPLSFRFRKHVFPEALLMLLWRRMVLKTALLMVWMQMILMGLLMCMSMSFSTANVDVQLFRWAFPASYSINISFFSSKFYEKIFTSSDSNLDRRNSRQARRPLVYPTTPNTFVV